MIREAFGTAKTVDEAIENGCLLLGVDRDDAEFEIIDLPKRGFFKRRDAKVRVFVELPDEKPKPAVREAAPKTEKPEPRQKPQAERQEPKPAAQPKPKQEKIAKANPEKAAEPKQERPKRTENKPAAKREDAKPAQVIEPTEETSAKAQLAVDYVGGILAAMGLTDVEIKPVFTTSGVSLALTGEGLGVIIGRRGETLDSLQYLAGLVANRPGGEYLRVTIDSGNYRQKRETTLEALARKLANQVVRSGKSATLEPMNPYERRIIHAAVSSVRGASSSSVGEEPNRRVVISASGEKNDRGDRNDRNDRGGDRRSRPRRPAGKGREPRRDDRFPKDEPPNRGGYRDYRDDLAPANSPEPGARPAPAAATAPAAPSPRRDAEPKTEQKFEPRAEQRPAAEKAPLKPKEKNLYEAELGGKLYGKIDI